MAHIPAIDITRYTVDQQLDAVDVAFAVEGAEGGLAGFGAETEFGRLYAGHLADQFPAVYHVLVLHTLGTHYVDRSQDAACWQGAGVAGIDRHFPQYDH